MIWKKALQYMKKGGYCRLPHWGCQSYLYYNDKLKKVLTCMGNEIRLDNLRIRKDWEICSTYVKYERVPLPEPIRPEEK